MNLTSVPLLLAAVAVPGAIACGDDDGPPAAVDATGAADADVAADAPIAAPGLRIIDALIAVDLTPDGRTAAVEQLEDAQVALVLVDTITGEAKRVATIGDATRDLATGMSAELRVTALHGVPVQAGVWDDGAWLDLESPFDAGCDQDLGGAWDVSADGHVVVGLVWNGCTPQAFRWTDVDDEGGPGELALLDLIGAPQGGAERPPVNRASVVSDDGRIAAGFAEGALVDRSPALWNEEGAGVLLDPDGAAKGTPGEVLAIDAEGETLAGNLGFEGFRWTADSGAVLLPRPVEALPSDPVFPNAISADGSIVFGGVGSAFFGVPVAFAWTEARGSRSLASIAAAAGVTIPEGLALISVLAASADGTVLLGNTMDADAVQQTFVLRLPAGAYD